MKCGSPIPCATERASRTASAEQQDAAASFSTSRHSSSVTAIASSPTSSAATAESTPPLIATSVRARRRHGCRPRSGAQRAVQRVRGEIRRVQLARREPAELLDDRARPDPRGVEQQLTLDQRHDRRAGRGQRAAARGVEPGLDDAVALDADRDADQVTADRTAGGAVMPPGKHNAAPIGRGEMLFESFAVHDRLSLGLAVQLRSR